MKKKTQSITLISFKWEIEFDCMGRLECIIGEHLSNMPGEWIVGKKLIEDE